MKSPEKKCPIGRFFFKHHTDKIVHKKGWHEKVREGGKEEMSPIYEQMALVGCAASHDEPQIKL